jgi:hypothetical protein
MQPEKYLIINNPKHQYVIVIKCNARTVEDYINYGKKATTYPDGSICFHNMSQWLVSRNIKHRMLLGKEKNLLLRLCLYIDICKSNKTAKKHELLLSDNEINIDLDKIECDSIKREDLYWNFTQLHF